MKKSLFLGLLAVLIAFPALAASPTAIPTPVPFSSAAAPQATPTASPVPCTLIVTDLTNGGTGQADAAGSYTLNIPIGDSFTVVVVGGSYLLNGGPASKTPPWTLDANYLGKQAIISTSGCTPALSIRVVGQ